MHEDWGWAINLKSTNVTGHPCPRMPEMPHLQLHGVDEAPTLVTLVTAGLWVAAEGTHTLHEAVGEETLAGLAAQLLHRVLDEETTLVETPEDVLSNPGRQWKHRRQREPYEKR